MRKERRLYGSENPNSFMMLGLLNTLCNNGTITKEDKDDILNLGEYIEFLSNMKDAKKIKAKLEELK